MVRLKKLYRIRVKSSSLVEVLVALVILLTVFAMGMLIFARLMQANNSQTSQQAHVRLQQLKALYIRKEFSEEQLKTTGHMQYSLEEESMESYSDRARVKLYAYDSEQDIFVDSLIFIIEKHEED